MKKNNYIKNISCILVVLFACIQGINAQNEIHIPDQITVKSGETVAERLIDGDFTTSWNSSRTERPSVANPEWIQFTYNQARAVRAVNIAKSSLNSNIGDIRDFRVEASNNGANWEILYTFENFFFNDPEVQSVKFTIDDSVNDEEITTYLQYRIVITKNRSGAAYARNTSSAEISLEGPAIEDDYITYIPDQISAKSTSNFFGVEVENLIDDDLTTSWDSNRTQAPSISNPEWVQFSYSIARVVRTITIAKSSLESNTGDIRDFKVQASNDVTNWENLFTFQGLRFDDPNSPTVKFNINNSVEYLNYRILITKNRSGDALAKNTSSGEITLKGPRILEDLNLEIYQIKVSEGHATLVVVKNIDTDEVVSSTLIDAGKTIADGELIAKTIIDNAGSKLDNVFITHYDRDHYGGLSPNDGLLDQRCKVGNSGEFNIVPANPIVNKLQLYGVKDDTQNRVPSSLNTRINTYINTNTLTFNSWEVDTELSLSGAGNEIKLITLAVNGTLRNGLQREKLSKNNRSGAALIVWGDFTFLVQGDIQGAGKDDQIGRTNAFYWPNQANPTKRIPINWETSTTSGQLAQNLVINTSAPASGSNSGILRLNVNEMDKAGLPAQNPIAVIDIENETDAQKALKGLSMFYHKYYIAYPNEWLHQLGGLIDDYNDAGNYAHACVALIPHHGAMSSNAWFDTKYGIISNNARGNHGHPLPQAVEAAYHTAGISDFYFTYLEDGKTYHGKVLDRLTEITNWKNNYVSTTVPFVQDVNFHVLDATQKYFKINVIQDEDGEKNFQINNGDAVTQSLIQCPNH